ncbi:MAG TPA: hypothetical protein VFG23_13275 [Polyangia bacterium]|nr:hypothetical protein [Polyangia bacterium]
MPDEPDETLDGELETDDEPKLAGAAATSALRKERKARQESERELRDLRARFKKIEDAEKSETERLRAEVDELRSERETEQAQVTAEREVRSKRDVVRRAAGEFADADDAIAALSLRGELDGIEDEADAKRALKQLATDKPYLLKQQHPQSPLDKVLQGGLPPGQAELDKALGSSGVKTGEEMYAMSDTDFMVWRRTDPEGYKKSLEGWTGNETAAAPRTETVAIRQ